jgi:Glycosyl hydrolase-like 10
MKHLLTLLVALLHASLPDLHAVEAPQPRGAEKLVVSYDDGFSSFYSGRYKTAEDLRKQMLLFKDTQVAVMEWCITSGSRVNFPAHTSELIGTGLKEFGRRGDQLAVETLHRLATEGVDTLQIVARSCHEAGMQCYANMRMNGDYSATTPEMSGQFNSDFWRAHPEFRIRGAKGDMRITLSYAYPAVRAFKLGILRAAAERDIDGLALDFLRHPPFFGYDEPLITAFKAKHGEDPRNIPADDPRWLRLRAEVMTDFLGEIRKMLDVVGAKKGRHIGLSARVDWSEHRALSCDVETWIKAGLLDYVVIAQHTLGGYEFDLTPFVQMAEGTGCAVLFGEEGITSGHDTTAAEDKLIAAGKMAVPTRGVLSTEQLQSRAARWFAAGADGVHLFNIGNIPAMKTLGSAKATTTDGAKSNP